MQVLYYIAWLFLSLLYIPFLDVYRNLDHYHNNSCI